VSQRRGAVALPSVIAGGCLALSIPPVGLWPLAFVGAGLLYWRLGDQRPRTRLLAGWLAGLGCFVPGLFSLQSFNWYGAAALMAIEALSMAFAAAASTPRRWRVPSFVGAFTVAEAIRFTWPFGGLPLGGVFLGQGDGPLLASARLGGPLLLSALVWLGGAGVGELARGVVRKHRHAERGGIGAAGTCIAGVVALGVFGALAPNGGPVTGHVRAAVVQGGGRRGFSKEQVDPAAVFAAQLRATADLLDTPRATAPRLVIWPEDVISISGPLDGSPQAETMAALARHLRATVVAGVTETVSSQAFRNEAVAWGPSGHIVAVYEKVHRVPFGEYVPFRSFFAHFADLSAVPLDAVPGHGDGLMRTPAGPLGVMVSFEVFYADRSGASVAAGARLLIVPTNTSSYGTEQVPAQELAADRVQAVERGRALLQAAPTGYSTMVNPAGTVLVQSRLSVPAVLETTVGLHAGSTIYDELGDGPVLAAAALGLAWAWLASAWLADPPRRRRRRCASITSPVDDSHRDSSVVVAGVDVDAGNADRHEHGVV